jgi:hypothetical protein
MNTTKVRFQPIKRNFMGDMQVAWHEQGWVSSFFIQYTADHPAERDVRLKCSEAR